jgi:hypothetical protein
MEKKAALKPHPFLNTIVYVAEIIPKGKIIEIKEQKIRWYSQE